MAGNLSWYYKGGILPLLYWPFKVAGLSPYISALIVNSSAWLLLGASLWLWPSQRRDRVAQILASFTLSLFGIWWAGMVSIVNADLPHMGMVALGLALLFRYSALPLLHAYVLGSIIILALGLTIRMQGVVVFALVACLMLLSQLSSRLRSYPLVSKRLLTVVLFSLVLSLFLEGGLRSHSKDTVGKSRYARTALYSGLLVAEAGARCGSWSRYAHDVSLKELSQPLHHVIYKHLSRKDPRDLARLFACKVTRFLLFHEFSFRWLTLSLHRNRMDRSEKPGQSDQATQAKLLGYSKMEKTAGIVLKVLLIILIVALPFQQTLAVNTKIYVFSILLFIGYLALHLIFEIQHRYAAPYTTYCLMTLIYSVRYLGEKTAKTPSHPYERDRLPRAG